MEVIMLLSRARLDTRNEGREVVSSNKLTPSIKTSVCVSKCKFICIHVYVTVESEVCQVSDFGRMSESDIRGPVGHEARRCLPPPIKETSAGPEAWRKNS